jgi:shikimate dehydrogenase
VTIRVPRLTFGILGHPVGHSRSPAMQTAALRAVGLDAEYVPFDVQPAQLAEAVRGLRLLGVAGLNVTVPHKEAVVPLLDDVSADARRIGAVNTVVVDHDRWVGENTDVAGLRETLAELSVAPDVAVVVGGGGAARAAVAALAAAGARHVFVTNRTPARAEAVAALAAAFGLTASVVPLSPDALAPAFARASVLVQASAAGMHGVASPADWPDVLPLDALPPSAAVVDLVYAPRPTALTARATARGLRAADGLTLLLHQGARAFTAWTRMAAPLDEMRRVLAG